MYLVELNVNFNLHFFCKQFVIVLVIINIIPNAYL